MYAIRSYYDQLLGVEAALFGDLLEQGMDLDELVVVEDLAHVGDGIV